MVKTSIGSLNRKTDPVKADGNSKSKKTGKSPNTGKTGTDME